ncbi:MAG: hypothetical protein WD673_11120 [Alphaproteobacteria bacterium]
MTWTSRELDLLIDMVENRLSDMMVVDREDVRERNALKTGLTKLTELRGQMPRGRHGPARDIAAAEPGLVAA